MAQELSCQIESAIIDNHPGVLEAILKRVDIKLCQDLLSDSALFLAVKLSRGSMVKILLSFPGCNPNHQNMHSYRPLDIALVMAFDNQKEPRQSACWNILEILLEAGAEPACTSGLSFVIRSAFKCNNDQFMLRLIHTLTLFSTSLDLHSLFLWGMDDLWPLYTGTHCDDFLESSAYFTIKLLKCYGKEALDSIVCCLSCYSDSHWDSQDRKEALMTKLVVYLTICGWKWRNAGDFHWIGSFHPQLQHWCRKMQSTVHSLTHTARLSIISIPTARKHFQLQVMPKVIKNYISFCDIDAVLSSPDIVEFEGIQL